MMYMTVQPLATIPGGGCLKEYRILPNKREILTCASAGNVALWSVLFVSGCGVLVEVGVSLMPCGCGEVGVSLMPCGCGEVDVSLMLCGCGGKGRCMHVENCSPMFNLLTVFDILFMCRDLVSGTQSEQSHRLSASALLYAVCSNDMFPNTVPHVYLRHLVQLCVGEC